MKRGGVALVGMAVLAWACTSGPELPAPTIVSVEPATLPVNTKDGELTVQFEARYAVAVDYADKTASDRVVSGRVWLDETEATVTHFDPEGVAIATVPKGLGAGVHALRLRLDDGRENVKEDALELVPPGHDKEEEPDEDAGVLMGGTDAGPVEADFDAGTRTDGGAQPGDPILQGDITGYAFDPIEGARTIREAFSITLHAEGPRAPHFNGSLEVASSRGKVKPQKIGPCESGVCTATVSVDATAGTVQLIVTDGYGVTATSNLFTLSAPP
ncbi:hypothetical protein D7V97_27910 [Corallococcus sp. CA053C]|uniref:hypothetical protein n=1 Tax=Corallococcus sp. CA053C TaxID=2316732 RepID=UPI000EA3675B|nr:hypothetical protein [Corallococcus sp. CA053C]RKH02420.1 hypothetical protein D7V97_27910 [Corallococcus sp. CA053C]